MGFFVPPGTNTPLGPVPEVPMTWTYDWEGSPGVAVVAVNGRLVRDGLATLRCEILGHARFPELRGYVVDFQDADATGLTASDMRSLAAQGTPFSHATVRRALVVSDAQAHGLAAVYRGTCTAATRWPRSACSARSRMRSAGSTASPAKRRRQASCMAAAAPSERPAAGSTPMAWTFDWDALAGLALVTVTGTVRRAALAELRVDIMAQPRIHEVAGYVIDFRSGDLSGLSPADIRSLAASDATEPTDPPLPRAFVVGDTLALGLGNMYRGHLQGRAARTTVGIFLSLDDAADWLARFTSR